MEDRLVRLEVLLAKLEPIVMNLAGFSTAVLTWMTEKERIEKDHIEDIEALKKSQEYIGKTIGGLKKEISELKKQIN